MTHGYPRNSPTTVLSNWLSDILGNHGREPGHSRQMRQRHWQLNYLAPEALATEVLATETLVTETEAPAAKSTSVAGSSIANNNVTILFVVSLFISPLIFNIVNYT